VSASPESRAPAAAALDPGLARAGFNLVGALDADRYAAMVPAAWRPAVLLPTARTVLVLGCGGRAFGRAALAAGAAPDPFDRLTRRAAGAAAAALQEQGWRALPVFYFERRGDAFADFVALARASGLGAPSRLGLLLHPVYGPWISIRALLLTERPFADTGALAFAPCDGCPAPCAAACHGAAVGPDGLDAAACASTRAGLPACALRCDARRACVVGREHAYAEEVEALHARASLARGQR
jgi:epoxyqueuosine reductase